MLESTLSRRAVRSEGEAWQAMLMHLRGSGVVGSVSAHILPAWLGARQVLSGRCQRGPGGGVMTAESISTSRDGVRSKSRHGGAQPFTLT